MRLSGLPESPDQSHTSHSSQFRQLAQQDSTCISAFVAQYSYPLNYKPSLYDLQNRTEYNHPLFAFQKEREMSVLPLHPVVFSFLWLTPGLEPCSPHSQCGTLPDKLKPTFVTKLRIELRMSDSNSDVLPITPPGSCGSYENRTHSNRSTICDVNRYTNEPGNLYGPDSYRENPYYKNENLASSPVRRTDHQRGQ